MKYELHQGSISDQNIIELNKEQYEEIVQAKNNLLELLFLEEKYDYVLSNFHDFEMSLLEITTNTMLFNTFDIFLKQKDRYLINNRIANLLSACKLYIDHSSHHINKVFGKDSDIALKIKNARENQYDSSFSYRFLSALRNHVQHFGFPIYKISYPGKWMGDNHDEKLRFSLTPHVSVSELKNNKKFKSSVLKEIQDENYISIKPVIRDYIGCLSVIHSITRELIIDKREKWEKVINKAMENNLENLKSDKKFSSIRVVSFNEKNEKEVTWVTSNFLKSLSYLENKNRKMKNLAKFYVSSEEVG